MGDPEALREAFSLQYHQCRGLGAEVAAAILHALRRDIETGGATASLVADLDFDPVRGNLPLRLLAAVHRLALAGGAPELEAHFPSMGGTPDPENVADPVLARVRSDAEALRAPLAFHPQTNEVARSAALFAGIMTVWQRTGLPMQLYELGASAGLNLHFDRFRYRLGIYRWGDPHSPVQLHPRWAGDFLPEEDAPIEIASRAGCDIDPIDVADRAQALRLCSYVWPDDPERLDRLRAAIALAREAPIPVDRDDALDWVADRLETMRPGRSTVVYHSVFWTYLSREERAELTATIEQAADEARIGQPLAWLRFEHEEEVFRLRLRIWPAGHGRDEVLAEAHPHCRWIRWRRRGIRPLIEEMDD